MGAKNSSQSKPREAPTTNVFEPIERFFANLSKKRAEPEHASSSYTSTNTPSSSQHTAIKKDARIIVPEPPRKKRHRCPFSSLYSVLDQINLNVLDLDDIKLLALETQALDALIHLTEKMDEAAKLPVSRLNQIRDDLQRLQSKYQPIFRKDELYDDDGQFFDIVNNSETKCDLKEYELLQHSFKTIQQQLSSTTRAFSSHRLQYAENIKSGNYQKAEYFMQRMHRELYRLTNSLPALAQRDDVIHHIKSPSQFLIVRGQTGSGKSTQLPQYLADHEEFHDKMIICTQPRKFAASTLAKRVQEEYRAAYCGPHTLDNHVRYQSGPSEPPASARILFFSESLFLSMLAETGSDRPDSNNPAQNNRRRQFKKKKKHGPKSWISPEKVGAIIIDEAHERSLVTDILIGFLKINPLWSKVKVIITSASLDVDLFQKYLDCCPVVEIPGKSYHIELKYLPPPSSELAAHTHLVKTAVDHILKIMMDTSQADGDILCFLTGQDDVEKAKSLLEIELDNLEDKSFRDTTKTFVLYGKQLPEDQEQVFLPVGPGNRKIIFSTDVAETSVTINNLKYVIDMGLTKNVVYDASRNISALKVLHISQSSALQRMGRVGRTMPGICHRIYSEEFFNQLEICDKPEILRKPLTILVASLLKMNINPRTFPWLQSPDAENVSNSFETLRLYGAIAQDASFDNLPDCLDTLLTPVGELVVSLQVDPGVASMLKHACTVGLGTVGATLAALNSLGNAVLWYGGDRETKHKARAAHESLQEHTDGDFVLHYHIFQKWLSKKNRRGRKKAVEWALKYFVNNKSMNLANSTLSELKNKLRLAGTWTTQSDSHPFANNPSNQIIQDLVLRMQYLNMAVRIRPGFYKSLVGAGEIAIIHKGSSLHDCPEPEWLIYHSLFHTQQVYLTQVTPANMELLKEISPSYHKQVLDLAEKYKLVPLVIKNILRHIQLEILGPKDCKAQEVINLLQCNHIEGDVQKKTITCWCTAYQQTEVERAILELIECAKIRLRRGVIQQIHNKVSRVVYGEGLEVVDIICDPEKYIDLTFPRNYLNLTPGKLERYCTDIIAKVVPTLSDPKEGIRSFQIFNDNVVVTFSDTEIAQKVDEYIHTNDPNTIGVNTGTFQIRSPLRIQVVVEFELAPQQQKQIGISSYYTGKLFFKSAREANRVCLADYLDAVPAKKEYRYSRQYPEQGNTGPYSLLIKSYSPFQPIRAIKLDMYRKGLPIPDGIVIYREPIPTTATSSDQNTGGIKSDQSIIEERQNIIRTKILQAIGNEVKDGFERNYKTLFVKTWFVESKEQANLLLRKLKSISFDPNITDTRCKPFIQYSCSLTAPAIVKRTRTKVIDDLVDRFQSGYPSNSMRPLRRKEELNDDAHVEYTAESMDKDQLISLIQEFADLVCTPSRIILVSDIAFSSYGMSLLNDVKKEYAITWNERASSILIWDDSNTVQNACAARVEKINEELESLTLMRRAIKPDRLEELISKLNENPSYFSSMVNPKQSIKHTEILGQKLCVLGISKSVEALFEKISFELVPKRQASSQATSDFECPICMCEFNQNSDTISLIMCDHKYCKDCLHDHISSSKLPICCPHPDCNSKLIIEDLKAIDPKFNSKKFERLKERAIQNYVLAHTDSVVKCPKPDCNSILGLESVPVTTSTRKRWKANCANCFRTYCINCTKSSKKPTSHLENEECPEIQLQEKDLLELLNNHCPRCQNAFYDFDGCFAITCGCGCAFCGFCLKDCGDDAHPHVGQCSLGKGQWSQHEDFFRLSRARNKKKIQAALKQVKDLKRRRELLEAIKPHLLENKIEISLQEIEVLRY